MQHFIKRFLFLKKTFNLFKMKKKYNSLEQEQKYQSFWADKKVYAYNPEASQQDSFIIDTPPPTVSGSLHIGHVFSYTQTDILARFQRMQGKNIFYPMGWDDNGLPTEKRIQKLYNIYCDPNEDYVKDLKIEQSKKKSPLQKVSRKNFLEICHKQVLEDEKIYKNLWSRLGLSIDWNQTYETINNHSQKISQKSFLDLHKKNLVENRLAPVLWDVSFQTAVAQADVEDREKQGFYHNILFEIQGAGAYPIATTRPELLAACIAVCAHPDDSRYNKFFSHKARTPLFEAEVPILPSKHVDPEKGTGLLMVCTFGDIEDVRFWKQNSLPLKQILTERGQLKPLSFEEGVFKSTNPQKANQHYKKLEGLRVNQARLKIVELLKQEKLLTNEPEAINHFVKFYEKGDKPLEFILTRQWFVKILDYKKEFIKIGKQINWHPPSFFNRYQQWVENLNQDWCISRQRFFGVPFPLWYGVDSKGQIDYKKVILPSEKDLPIDPMKDTPINYKPEQRNQPHGFVADPNVMDTWATSSLTPFINSHWDQSQRHKKLFPCDLRPQAHEIIRTWAFYTIVKSYFHEKSPPWKHIAISGWVVDPQRSKMSKSKGNTITPASLMDKYSPDGVRYWAGKSRLGQDTVYDENSFKTGQKIVTKLFNAAQFVHLQIEGSPPFTPQFFSQKLETDVTEAVDQGWICELEKRKEQAYQNLSKFDYASSLDLIEKTFWSFCDHYLELIKSRTYQLKQTPQGLSGLLSLDYSLYLFLKMFSIYFPYITEEIWSWRYLPESLSIHSSQWPPSLFKKKSPLAQGSLNLAFELLQMIRNEKAQQQKSLVTKVSQISITLPSSQKEHFELCKPDLIRAGHIEKSGLCVSFSSQTNQTPAIKLTLE